MSVLRWVVVGIVLLLLCNPRPSFATDGVLEINQACATGDGCFPGDTARFPVTLTSAGSYRLTSNLQVPDQDTSAIVVGADDVSLDLGGFEIRGVTVCSGSPPITPLSCAPAGSGAGIAVQSSSISNSEVAHGAIAGMGSNGVELGASSHVRDLRVSANAGVGITVGRHSLVAGSSATRNGSYGVLAGSASVLRDSTASANGGDGISTNPGCSLRGNAAESNAGVGLSCSFGCNLRENTANGNGAGGISSSGYSTVSGNTAWANGDLATEHGISCLGFCTVEQNTVSQNRGLGLELGTNSGYRANVIAENVTGGVSGGVNRGSNLCTGTGVVSPDCP